MTGVRAGAALALALLALASCGGKPMTFPVPDSEMGPAPGLFTGPTGSYEIPIVKNKPSDPAPGPAAGPAPAGAPK